MSTTNVTHEKFVDAPNEALAREYQAFSIWQDRDGTPNRLAVMDGPRPQDAIVGHILKEGDYWVIENDGRERMFLNDRSAAYALVGRALPPGVDFYRLVRGEDTRFFATPESDLPFLEKDGWIIAAKCSFLPAASL